MTVDDPIDATAKLIDMERNAKKRLGASPDQLIQKPKDGQSVAEWMHENRNVFGIPEAPDKYEIAMPEGFGTGPNDLKWDADFETKAREMAHKHGIPGEALQELTNLYASKVQGLSQDADAQYEASNQKMMGELKTDWGDQTTAKIAMAKSAAEMLATTAGLGSEQLSGIAQVLSDKTGDAGAIKMFAAIGEMMAEDGVGKLPGNGGSLAMTPANARAELNKQKAPGGEYYEAVAKGDTATLARLKPKIDQLEKQAAPQ
ncbi:hypothetical protein [Roseobacter sp. TSBP12]|uniref:hypothetical protein n=1 Tax=Roseobacter sp. TSBP12 TaxID=1236613 RepID=UPI00125F7B53|nr:hypothetical protein [Roseobacter sp. TSBP12]KAB6717711.1 hypothetical protein C8029_04115 [Roseobacter sp. TSBP12]